MSTAGVTGIAGNGFRCNDAPSKQYISTTFQVNLLAWTIETWIKADAAPFLESSGGHAGGPIFGSRTFGIVWDHNDTHYLGALQLRDGNLGTWPNAPFGKGHNYTTGESDLTGGVWYHFVGVYSFISLDFELDPFLNSYRNGELITHKGSPDVSGIVSAPNSNMYLGVESNTNNPFNGIIDEVRISAKPQTDSYSAVQYLSMTDVFIDYDLVETKQ